MSRFQVGYYKENFNMCDPQQSFKFMFQLYNFLSGATAHDKPLVEPETLLDTLNESVAGYPSLLAAAKPKAAGNVPDGRCTQPSSRITSSFDNASVQSNLVSAGITLDKNMTELQPLNPVSIISPHPRTVQLIGYLPSSNPRCIELLYRTDHPLSSSFFVTAAKNLNSYNISSVGTGQQII
jgi:hypothetical protein